MSCEIIAVNGQHLTLTDSGGAGRYAQQIYKRLIDPTYNTLTDYAIQALNFSNTGPKDKKQKKQVAPIVRLLKNSIYQCCPPVVFKIFQKAYKSTKGHPSFKADQLTVNVANDKTDIPFDIKNIRLLHELTNYMSHNAIGRLSNSSNLALVVTFLDIQDYYFPEYFHDKILNERRKIYSFYKDRADFFIAISEFTKKTMVEKLGISDSKIWVTSLAADDMLILKPSRSIITWVESFKRYWIYPAKLWKHKNHDFLIKTLGKRHNELKRAGIKLLLTGSFNEVETQYLDLMVSSSKMGDIVKVLGFVSDEELQALLKGAEFLIFPSLFEGFGMPVLEAMSLGCPVLSSNAGSLPEVAGDAAAFFNPTKEEDLIDLIDSILFGNEVDRQTMIRKGLDNCKRFSWNRTYRETIRVYSEVLQ